MTKLHQIFKCEICGNIVAMVHDGAGELVCCGQPMTLQEANTIDVAAEKHVPVIEKIDGGYLIRVGSDPHPMTEEHYIEWIELRIDNCSYRCFLSPGNEPIARFKVEGDEISARIYCNLHGLWQS